MTDFETNPVGTMQELRRVMAERDELAARLNSLRPIAQYGLRAARSRNNPASLEWTNTLADTPATSLARLKAEWLEDLLNSIPYKDLHTNNGDMRQDAHYRDGWNSCREHFRRQAEGERP